MSFIGKAHALSVPLRGQIGSRLAMAFLVLVPIHLMPLHRHLTLPLPTLTPTLFHPSGDIAHDLSSY